MNTAVSLDLYNPRSQEAVWGSGALASPQVGSSSPQLALHVESGVGDVQYQVAELLDSSLGMWGEKKQDSHHLLLLLEELQYKWKCVGWPAATSSFLKPACGLGCCRC